jgi:hypothetical protein
LLLRFATVVFAIAGPRSMLRTFAARVVDGGREEEGEREGG